MEALTKENAQQDLTIKMAPYWDAQMLLPVMTWLKTKNIYPIEEIEREYEKTKATVLATPDQVPQIQEAIAQKEALLQPFMKALVVYKRDQLATGMSGVAEKKSISAILDWWIRYNQINKDPNDKRSTTERNEALMFPKNADVEVLQLAHLFMKLQEFSKAKQYLDFYKQDVAELTIEGSQSVNHSYACWGIALTVILTHALQPVEISNEFANMGSKLDEDEVIPEREKPETNTDMDAAASSLLKLSELLDSSDSTSKEMMLKRSWMLHWVIWPIFRYQLVSIHKKACQPSDMCWSVLPDWFISDSNLAVVQFVAPHLLRYYAVYGILNRKRKDHFNSIIKAISNSKHKYSDSLTSLIEALFIDFDFDAAQHHVAGIASICESDYFLEQLKDSIEQHSHLLIFETYCRTHKSINVDMIAKKVNMTPEATERWIVNLIRNEKLDAKIDSEKNGIEMDASAPSLSQQISDKTRNLMVRTSMVYQNMSRPLSKTDVDIRDAPKQRGGRNRGGRTGGDYGDYMSNPVNFSFRGRNRNRNSGYRGNHQGGHIHDMQANQTYVSSGWDKDSFGWSAGSRANKN